MRKKVLRVKSASTKRGNLLEYSSNWPKKEYGVADLGSYAPQFTKALSASLRRGEDSPELRKRQTVFAAPAVRTFSYQKTAINLRMQRGECTTVIELHHYHKSAVGNDEASAAKVWQRLSRRGEEKKKRKGITTKESLLVDPRLSKL